MKKRMKPVRAITVKLSEDEYALLCELQRTVGRIGMEKAFQLAFSAPLDDDDEFCREKFTKGRAINFALRATLVALQRQR